MLLPACSCETGELGRNPVLGIAIVRSRLSLPASTREQGGCQQHLEGAAHGETLVFTVAGGFTRASSFLE
jgi:hypothetical protein